MDHDTSFVPLFVVVILAFIVPLLLSRMRRFRLPIVVGEILAGMVVGQSGLNLVQGEDPLLRLLSEFGFVFLMFLSGMEIDFSNLGTMVARKKATAKNKSEDLRSASDGFSEKNKIQELSQNPIALGVFSFLITLIISVVLGFGLYSIELTRNPFMIALILSTTSLGVVLPVLKERGLTTGRFGQTILIAALIADFATMLLITLLVAQISTGLTLDILLIGLLFVAFFIVYRFGMIFFNKLPVVRKAIEELSHATAQIKVRAAFMMMLVFVVFAQLLSVEVILGAFLAGAVVSLLRTPQDAGLSAQLEAIGFGFFIPIFFIQVGITFNLQALLGSSQGLALIPLLLTAAFLVKMISSLVFRNVFSWRETIAAGSLLSARLSLIIAASAIGLGLGIISETVNSAIILVAILTVTGAPLLFNRILPESISEDIRPILVVGAGELGTQVSQELLAHGERAVLVDPDTVRIQQAFQRKIEAIESSLDSPNKALLYELDKAKALICTIHDVEINFRVCNLARADFGIDDIIAYVSQPNELERFKLIGVTPLSGALDRAILLAFVARNPAIYDLLYKRQRDNDFSEVVVQNRWCSNRSLREMRMPGDVLVVALRRNGELIIPNGDTNLECGDHLTLMGSLQHLQDAREIFLNQ